MSYFLENVKKEIDILIDTIDESEVDKACELILKSNRVHITGIGKPSYVARYISSLLSSTGTPCYFLDGTEAIHGSLGQVLEDDVVIAISNSGNTKELNLTINALKNNNIKIISVTGNKNSKLAKESAVCLIAHTDIEGDTLNKPPRISYLLETIILQYVSIKIQEQKDIDLELYYKWHPGGSLGESIREVIS